MNNANAEIGRKLKRLKPGKGLLNHLHLRVSALKPVFLRGYATSCHFF